jgi:hypothetical protein
MRSYRMINSHRLVATGKKGGKVTLTARIVVSPDGKSRTVIVHGMDANGMKTTSTEVYDKQ